MKDNFNLKVEPISLCVFSYRKSYYLTHPWKIFEELWIGAKNFYRRGRYGYAYVDAWNMSNAWCEMGANMFIHIAKYGCGYPGHEPFDTPEKWRNHLYELAAKLRKYANFETAVEDENGYWPEFEKRILYKDLKNLTEDEKDLRAKYYAREKEIWRDLQRETEETFALIGKNLYSYWD
jgi:hypothetical protein